MTPREIRLLFQAYETMARRRIEDFALLGRYMALAVHAPDRLPPLPPPNVPASPMTDEEIKRRLMQIAGKEENL